MADVCRRRCLGRKWKHAKGKNITNTSRSFSSPSTTVEVNERMLNGKKINTARKIKAFQIKGILQCLVNNSQYAAFVSQSQLPNTIISCFLVVRRPRKPKISAVFLYLYIFKNTKVFASFITTGKQPRPDRILNIL